MNHSQVLIQFCVRQNKALKTLDQLSETVSHFYNSINLDSSPRLKKAAHQIASLQNHLKKEFEHLYLLAKRSPWIEQNFYLRLDQITVQIQSLAEEISIKWQESGYEEWKTSLSSLSQKVDQLKTDLRKINLKEALNSVADAILIDQFDSLGHTKAIQWGRKLFHFGAALLIIFIYLVLPGALSTKLWVFGSITFALTVADICRLLSPKINQAALKLLPKIMRKEEVSKINSMTFFAVSTFSVCTFFPKGIAILSVLFLGIGDCMASIVGIKWGKHKITRGISLEGSLAFFASCFLISLLYPFLTPSFSGPILLFAFLGGIVAMFSEWAALRIDDNFIIPLVSAIGLSLISWLVG